MTSNPDTNREVFNQDQKESFEILKKYKLTAT